MIQSQEQEIIELRRQLAESEAHAQRLREALRIMITTTTSIDLRRFGEADEETKRAALDTLRKLPEPEALRYGIERFLETPAASLDAVRRGEEK